MVKKGDLVKILAGKDKGKSGKIERVLPKENKVVVTGINMVKKHQKPTKYRTQAGIIDIAMPLQQSNVMIICPNCSKPTRTGFKVNKDQKMRICKKCKEVIDNFTPEKK
jgi:large subunit ribosomal protein L24